MFVRLKEHHGDRTYHYALKTLSVNELEIHLLTRFLHVYCFYRSKSKLRMKRAANPLSGMLNPDAKMLNCCSVVRSQETAEGERRWPFHAEETHQPALSQ